MTKKTTAKLCGVIRDGLKASPRHADDCTPNEKTGWRSCSGCHEIAMRRIRALAALDQLEAVLPLEK